MASAYGTPGLMPPECASQYGLTVPRHLLQTDCVFFSCLIRIDDSPWCCSLESWTLKYAQGLFEMLQTLPG